jgi:hypothetical protein
VAHQLDFLALEDQAKQAESLLGHPIFGEAAKALHQHYLAAIEAVPVGATERLVYEHMKVKVLGEVIASLQSYVNDYKFAAKHQKAKAA